MAGFNYVKSQKTADKLITKFGGKMAGKIFVPQLGSGPAANPGRGVPLEYPCTCVAVDYTVRERLDGNIQEGAKRVLVSVLGLPVGFEIEPEHKVQTPDGDVFSIVPPVGKFKPAKLILFYDLQGVR